MPVMSGSGPTWLVMVRDVSHGVRVSGQPHVHLALVLDADTGAARGSSVAATRSAALRDVFRAALTDRAGPLPPAPPDRVLCSPAIAADVVRGLGRRAIPPPSVIEVDPVAEAEDIFDSFVGHMSGRHQPLDFATPEDWNLLYEQARRYDLAAPWERWTDSVDLAVNLRVGGRSNRYMALVLGNEGIQHGLVLYPGSSVAPGLREWEPGREVPMPPGTLMFNLDPRSEPPPEFIAKAARYGWPSGAEMVPVFLTFAKEGPGEPGIADVRHLTVAIAAVLQHDARGPIVHGTGERTAGELRLAGRRRASFTVDQLAPAEPAGEDAARLVAHEIGWDLVSDSVPVVMGSLPWESLTHLRRQARIHRPAPPTAPAPSGMAVPLLAILPTRKGDALASRLAEEDPLGVAVIEPDSRALVVLACARGAHALMELATGQPALDLFRRRLRSTKGVHVVMVADEASQRGEGEVFALFECHLPQLPRARGARRPRQRA
jgi:hypothetical protein